MSTRTALVALSGGLVLVASLLAAGSGPHRISETSASALAAAPPPTATLVSELGPASVRPPRTTMALPPSGGAVGTNGVPWSQAAGLGLAIAGVFFVHAALRLRPAADARA